MADTVVRRALLKIVTDDGDAQAKIDRIAAKAEELGRLNPEIKVKVDAAAAAAEMGVLRRVLRDAGNQADSSGGMFSGLSRALLGTSAAAGGGGAGGGGLIASLAGLGAVITGPLIGALAVLITAYIGPLIAGMALVTVGVGAFAAAAFPVFSQLKSSLTALSTATDSYQQASLNLDQAIRKSPADLQAYRQSLQGLEPDLRSAARLLTDQNVQWQNLSPSQRKSVDALANNSAALKNLLPDQKNALTALMQQKAAWDNLSPAQQKIAGEMNQLGTAWAKIQKAVQPAVYTALGTAIKILNQLMPTLKILAVAAGNALDGLLKHISSWLASPAGQKFLHWMQVEGPRALATFGHFLWDLLAVFGNVAHFIAQAGDFMRARLSQNIHGISIQIDDLRRFFIGLGHDTEAVFNAIKHAVAYALDTVRMNLIGSGHQVEAWANDIGHWAMDAVHFFQRLPGEILSALAALPGMLFRAGVNAIRGLINGLESMIGQVGNVVSGIASKVAGFFGLSPAREGPLSGGGAPFIRGQHLGLDIAAGMDSSRGQAAAAAARLASAMAPDSGGVAGAAAGGGQQRLVLEVAGGQGEWEQFMATWLRKYIRIRGGNVQTALGHT